MKKTAKLLSGKRLGGYEFNLFGGNRIKNKAYLIDTTSKKKAIKIMRKKGYRVIK